MLPSEFGDLRWQRKMKSLRNLRQLSGLCQLPVPAWQKLAGTGQISFDFFLRQTMDTTFALDMIESAVGRQRRQRSSFPFFIPEPIPTFGLFSVPAPSSYGQVSDGVFYFLCL